MATADANPSPLPVIGLLGAPGSGKSTIAAMFAELGCAVVDADQLSREAMRDPGVQAELKRWWGPEIVVDGRPDRARIGQIVFGDPEARRRLEGLIHPFVNRRRREIHAELASDRSGAVPAVVEDCPLLIEAGLDSGSDYLVFVDTPLEDRQSRVLASRGWSAKTLAQREAAQAPLDTKLAAADYTVLNVGDRDTILGRVADVLKDILHASARGRTPRNP